MHKNKDAEFKNIVDGYLRKLSLSRDYRVFRYTIEDFLVDASKDKRLKYAYDRAKLCFLVGSIFAGMHPNDKRSVLRLIHYKDHERVF